MHRHIVMTAAAQVPSSWKWRHTWRKVAVVRLQDDFAGTPKMISERAKGVDEIVYLRDRLHVGTTDRCEFRRALAEAEALAAKLNAEP